jgi:L-ascorbate metabolism protein UlaG (beta-lactamase superfamily)/uncharacterized protein YbjT (DUF2867 family)
MKKTALVLGASSQVGVELLPLLLADETYTKVITLNRYYLPLTHEKLSQFVIDFDDAASYANLIEGDDIFYCMGTATRDKQTFLKIELDYAMLIAATALDKGAKQLFFISALSANANSRIFYLKIKGQAEKQLLALNYHAFYIFRPSIISGIKDKERFSQRLFAFAAKWFPFLFWGILRKLGPIPARSLAEAMVKLAATNRQGKFIYRADEIVVIADSQKEGVVAIKPKKKYAFKILVAFLSGILIAACILNLRRVYKGPSSDHFDGTHFYHDEKDVTFSEAMKWFITRKPEKWPKKIENKKYDLPPNTVTGGIRVTFINHATTLVQLDGINILTDPIWSERASPVSFAGPKRVREPGVDFDDLPRIDIVLISHNHYDHMDISTLKKLTKKFDPVILTGLGVSSALDKNIFKKVKELDWWQKHSSSFPLIDFVFVPARHNSGRGIFDSNKTLWGGFVIVAPSGSVYFSGDTGYGSFLNEIHARYAAFDLALLPVGAFEPRQIMYTHHMNPDDAVKTHQLLHVKQSIGIHFGTFNDVTDEAIDAPGKQLSRSLKIQQVDSASFRILDFGESILVKTVKR